MTQISLVADVGGTNTRVALARGAELQTDTIVKYRNKDHAELGDLLGLYLGAQGVTSCTHAAVAIAGPVRDGAGRLTNLDWHMDRDSLARVTGAQQAAVLNDLQAQGHALGHLEAVDQRVLWPGQPAAPDATMLVIGVGTGFNCAPVFQTPHGRLVPPSEAGHLTCSARGRDQAALVAFLEADLGHVAVEDLLSGRGLEACFRWAAHEAGQGQTASTAEIFKAAEAGDPLAIKAITAFARALGGVVGDLALTLLPFGGIYLVGGMSCAIAPWLERSGFHDAMTDKGRFGAFVDAFAVNVVENDCAALWGCAGYLARATAD